MPEFECALDRLSLSDPENFMTSKQGQDKVETKAPLSSTSTSAPSPVRDPSKRSFFDLPAELRLEIYTVICTTWLKDSAPTLPGNISHTKTILLADLATTKHSEWDTYSDDLTTLRSINAQYRRELTAIWAEHTIFRLLVPDVLHSCKDYLSSPGPRPYAQSCAIDLLVFLRRVGPNVSQYTPEILLVCTFGLAWQQVPNYFRRHEAWHAWTRTQAQSPLLGVGSLLEACEDVYPEMVLTVAFRCVDELSSWRPETTMAFRQGSQGWYALDEEQRSELPRY